MIDLIVFIIYQWFKQLLQVKQIRNTATLNIFQAWNCFCRNSNRKTTQLGTMDNSQCIYNQLHQDSQAKARVYEILIVHFTGQWIGSPKGSYHYPSCFWPLTGVDRKTWPLTPNLTSHTPYNNQGLSSCYWRDSQRYSKILDLSAPC